MAGSYETASYDCYVERGGHCADCNGPVLMSLIEGEGARLIAMLERSGKEN